MRNQTQHGPKRKHSKRIGGNKVSPVVALLGATAFAASLSVYPNGASHAATFEEQVDDSFYLNYDFAGNSLPPQTIGADSVDQFADQLPPAIVESVKSGDLVIDVKQSRSFAPHEAYIAATRANGGNVAFGTEDGRLKNFNGGRPFPEDLSPDDPESGQRLAWNIRYAYGGDSGYLRPMTWDYIDMNSQKIERTLEMEAANLTYLYRIVDDNKSIEPNPSEIYRAFYLHVTEPYDIRGTQLLVHRLVDDHARERTWIYLSTQRRVRALSSGQTTDAFLGSDIMIEDFLGYNGRLVDMNWRLLAKKDMLMPFYDGDGGKLVTFGGTGPCYPETPWQLRPTYVLEATPVESSHPLSKRIFFVDAQTSAITISEIYDRAGRVWKIGFATIAHPDTHVPQNHGTGAPILTAVSATDIQARHCTTITPTAVVNTDEDPKNFTVNSLRARGN